MSRQIPRSALAVLGVMATMTACSAPNSDAIAPHAARGGIFDRYVAIGNSITAGYQSGGITDATQRQSYALLLAQAMGTRYAYPSIAGRGCAPPIVNFQTQARPAGTTALTCDLRAASFATDLLNNVAVPGATVFDPTSTSTAASNALTTLILGGKTQVDRALMLKPTFATVWIGNNDVLGPAIQDGRTAAIATITPLASFTAAYDKIVDPLKSQNAALSGVLIGVVNVKNAPIMFPAVAFQSAFFKATFDAIAGTTTAIDPSCAPGGAGATSLINTFLAFQIRLGNHPPVVACVPGGASGALPPPVGDILVLDPAEQITLDGIISGYNTYISGKATSAGLAYVDPNQLLPGLKSDTAGSLVRNTPNYTSAIIPFGTGMSLDGVHPVAGVHFVIANALIKATNTKYGTSLPSVP